MLLPVSAGGGSVISAFFVLFYFIHPLQLQPGCSGATGPPAFLARAHQTFPLAGNIIVDGGPIRAPPRRRPFCYVPSRAFLRGGRGSQQGSLSLLGTPPHTTALLLPWPALHHTSFTSCLLPLLLCFFVTLTASLLSRFRLCPLSLCLALLVQSTIGPATRVYVFLHLVHSRPSSSSASHANAPACLAFVFQRVNALPFFSLVLSLFYPPLSSPRDSRRPLSFRVVGLFLLVLPSLPSPACPLSLLACLDWPLEHTLSPSSIWQQYRYPQPPCPSLPPCPRPCRPEGCRFPLTPMPPTHPYGRGLQRPPPSPP